MPATAKYVSETRVTLPEGKRKEVIASLELMRRRLKKDPKAVAALRGDSDMTMAELEAALVAAIDAVAKGSVPAVIRRTK